jgi:hypothetical protein
MISKEIIEEYLYDMLGSKFKYYSMDSDGYMFFKHDVDIIGYNSDRNMWFVWYMSDDKLGFSISKKSKYDKTLKNSDIKVWIRKKKLNKV